MNFVWTKKLPTEPGVYWRKTLSRKSDKLPDQKERICLIIRRDGKLIHCSNVETEFGTQLDLFNNGYSEWCGPLTLK